MNITELYFKELRRKDQMKVINWIADRKEVDWEDMK